MYYFLTIIFLFNYLAGHLGNH